MEGFIVEPIFAAKIPYPLPIMFLNKAMGKFHCHGSFTLICSSSCTCSSYEAEATPSHYVMHINDNSKNEVIYRNQNT